MGPTQPPDQHDHPLINTLGFYLEHEAWQAVGACYVILSYVRVSHLSPYPDLCIYFIEFNYLIYYIHFLSLIQMVTLVNTVHFSTKPIHLSSPT